MITIYEAKDLENPLAPLVTIEFPKPPNGPALELNLWVFKGRSQVEWVTEDGVALGLVWAGEC